MLRAVKIRMLIAVLMKEPWLMEFQREAKTLLLFVWRLCGLWSAEAGNTAVICETRTARTIDAGQQELKNRVIKKRPLSLRWGLRGNVSSESAQASCVHRWPQLSLVLSVKLGQVSESPRWHWFLKVWSSPKKQLRLSTMRCQEKPLVKVQMEF